MGRATQLLALAWGALGVFFVWDGLQSEDSLSVLLGVAALAVCVGNIVMFRRLSRRPRN